MYYEYEQAGIPEYWLIDPQKQWADCYLLNAEGNKQPALSGKEGKFSSHLLPGFGLQTEWLWQQPRPTVLDVLWQICPDIFQNAPTEYCGKQFLGYEIPTDNSRRMTTCLRSISLPDGSGRRQESYSIVLRMSVPEIPALISASCSTGIFVDRILRRRNCALSFHKKVVTIQVLFDGMIPLTSTRIQSILFKN